MNHIPTPRCCARVAKAFNGRNAAEVRIPMKTATNSNRM